MNEPGGLTLNEIIRYRERKRKKTDDSELRRLPYKHAFIYGRVSTPTQLRDSKESVREIARLVDLAKKDGYVSNLDPGDIEKKLASLDKRPSKDTGWSDGEIVVNVQDLGISGQLSFDEREGLAELQHGVAAGSIGCVYLTEGVSRLSRDKDRILPYRLLKLLKEHSCRIRTLDGVWNPAIEHDWDYLAEEFEDAIGELRVMVRRMHRRKAQKAGRGEYVGESVPLGYILPIIGQKPSGKYEFGKIQPYPPHSAIVNLILDEFVKQDGCYLKTSKSLEYITIPFFDKELQYMERLTNLRLSPRTITGYKITPYLIRGLAANLKLIGIWCYGDNEPIIDNHKSIVSQELFFKAFQLATNRKPKGKTVFMEPNEWSGLLYCTNHNDTHKILSHNTLRMYMCFKKYPQWDETHICPNIPARFIDMPLTDTILSHLDFTRFSEYIYERLKFKIQNRHENDIQVKARITRLYESIKRLQIMLTQCVDPTSGQIDNQKEEFYWNQMIEARRQLDEIKLSSRLRTNEFVEHNFDINDIRSFLKNLSKNWGSYSLTIRNRLLKTIINKAEVQNLENIIHVVIIWKSGFRQKVTIFKPRIIKSYRRWTDEECELLRSLYPSASQSDLLGTLQGRSLKAIRRRALLIGVERKRQAPPHFKAWTFEEDEILKRRYLEGTPLGEVAAELGRGVEAVVKRIEGKGLNRILPNKQSRFQASWEHSDLTFLDGSSSICLYSYSAVDLLSEIFLESFNRMAAHDQEGHVASTDCSVATVRL